jgi:hypothetical protein
MNKQDTITLRNERTSTSILLGGMIIAALLLFSISSKGPVYAHQKRLYTIGNNKYLIAAGFLNEPVYLDDKSGVDFYVYTSDPKDPMNIDSKFNNTCGGIARFTYSEQCAQI